MNSQDALKKTGDFIRSSATLKIFSIGILVLILLIPAAMISSLLREREMRKDSVVGEIHQKWGNRQTITGPFFTVPYKSYYTDEDEKQRFNIRYLHFLPRTLNISGSILPHVRYRGIYEAVLYNAEIRFDGSFSIPVFDQIDVAPENVLWEKAVFSLGITDMRGIQNMVAVDFDGGVHTVSPGLLTTDIAGSGLKSVIPLVPSGKAYTFSLGLNLNGSDQVDFIPVAETTQVNLKSDWPSPSFNGAFLPVERDVSENGFSAAWKVLHLNRNFPQYWTGNHFNVTDAAFGVKLLITTDIYQKASRVSKYAVMFIVFTFSAFFLSEIINRKRVHPIQYLLIGLAIMLFHVLLLSLSEHIHFDFSYILSAGAITALITGYSHGIVKNRYFTLTVFLILLILYAYLYMVLQLEDYALLMGSIGLLLVLATVMFITRTVNWYAIENRE